MRQGWHFLKLKSVFFCATLLALFSFGYQSAALPVHTSIHATQQIVTAQKSGPSVLESDCELCDLATHQAIQLSPIVDFESIEAVEPRTEIAPANSLFLRLARLPPVRGPPRLA